VPPFLPSSPHTTTHTALHSHTHLTGFLHYCLPTFLTHCTAHHLPLPLSHYFSCCTSALPLSACCTCTAPSLSHSHLLGSHCLGPLTCCPPRHSPHCLLCPPPHHTLFLPGLPLLPFPYFPTTLFPCTAPPPHHTTFLYYVYSLHCTLLYLLSLPSAPHCTLFCLTVSPAFLFTAPSRDLFPSGAGRSPGEGEFPWMGWEWSFTIWSCHCTTPHSFPHLTVTWIHLGLGCHHTATCPHLPFRWDHSPAPPRFPVWWEERGRHSHSDHSTLTTYHLPIEGHLNSTPPPQWELERIPGRTIQAPVFPTFIPT